MSNINDGGPAFPFQCQGATTAPKIYYGMTLREYFAAHAPAVPESFERCRYYETHGVGNYVENDIDRMIRWRWYYADAMLRRREVRS